MLHYCNINATFDHINWCVNYNAEYCNELLYCYLQRLDEYSSQSDSEHF